ncbi:MAG: glycosyltransferase family 2 protein [Limimaricola soesokkakensis]|uniref:glycosyltransferase family 2 protein n=1 Tax=Limimaricola soesokkakensis TaxID=1343159 RepID=UPI004057E6A4
MKNLDIVIVNWNSGVQLRECIDSVRTWGAGHVQKCIVVDNGSADGSADFLSEVQGVDLVRADRNLGFAAACNLGAKQGTSPFVLFLNPDAHLLKESLTAPIAFLEDPTNKKVGIVGIGLKNEDGSVQRSCARFPRAQGLVFSSFGLNRLWAKFGTHMHEWDHAESRDVPHVIGAFYMIRRELFQRLNGFDERFFVYLEDLDLSLRAQEVGYRSFYIAEAHAYHKGGGVSEQVKAHRLFYSLRSRILYAFKHFARPSALLVAAATLAIEPLTRLALLLARRRFGEVRDLLRGYRMLWTWAFAAAIGGGSTS